jgi:hypothetical protein
VLRQRRGCQRPRKWPLTSTAARLARATKGFWWATLTLSRFARPECRPTFWDLRLPAAPARLECNSWPYRHPTFCPNSERAFESLSIVRLLRRDARNCAIRNVVEGHQARSDFGCRFVEAFRRRNSAFRRPRNPITTIYVIGFAALCAANNFVHHALAQIRNSGHSTAMLREQRSANKFSSGENEIEPLLDEYEFSRITGRSVGSARRDRLLGRGCPFIKLGALVRYRPSDVRDYIQQNRKAMS